MFQTLALRTNVIVLYEGWSKSSFLFMIQRKVRILRWTVKKFVDTFNFSVIFWKFFKFNFINRRRCYHSLAIANIKQITEVVPEKIDFDYAWGSRSGTRQIWDWRHQTLSKNWPEISCFFLLKRTTPGNQKLTYAFNKPFLTYRKWYFAGKYFVHLQSAVKMKQ